MRLVGPASTVNHGATAAQVVDQLAASTRSHGWAMVHVGHDQAWTSTIGLSWAFGHPELIHVGRDHQATAAMLDTLVERIRAGTRFAVGSTHRSSGGQVIFGAVHLRNLSGEWFAQWAPVARAAGHGGASLRGWQVIDIAEATCPVFVPTLVLLDRKTTPDRIIHPRHDRPAPGRSAFGGRP